MKVLPKTGYEYLLDKFIVAQIFYKHKSFVGDFW